MEKQIGAAQLVFKKSKAMLVFAALGIAVGIAVGAFLGGHGELIWALTHISEEPEDILLFIPVIFLLGSSLVVLFTRSNRWYHFAAIASGVFLMMCLLLVFIFLTLGSSI